MSLRKFAILCMLRVAGSSRADYDDQELLQNEGQVLGSKTSSSDGSASQESNGLAFPQEVTNAVEKARALAEEAGRAAAAKMQAAKEAEDVAKEKIKTARQNAEAAAEKLERAQAFEQEQEAALKEREDKVEQATKADKDLNTAFQALEAARVVKQQAFDVYNTKQQAMKEEKTAFKLEDNMIRSELNKLNQHDIPNLEAKLAAEKRKAEELFRSLESQIATATARRNELGKMRTGEHKKRRTEKKAISKAFNEALTTYQNEKKQVESLENAALEAQQHSMESTSSAQAAVRAYWEKDADCKTASKEMDQAKDASDIAQAVAVESEFLYATMSSEMAQALQDKANADELKMKVEKVNENSETFYTNLFAVKEPTGNQIMALMKLASDPNMKDCLASYNKIIEEANSITQNDAQQVMSELKTGLVKIEHDRKSYFQQWCGEEDFDTKKNFIWGANDLEPAVLNIALPDGAD